MVWLSIWSRLNRRGKRWPDRSISLSPKRAVTPWRTSSSASWRVQRAARHGCRRTRPNSGPLRRRPPPGRAPSSPRPSYRHPYRIDRLRDDRAVMGPRSAGCRARAWTRSGARFRIAVPRHAGSRACHVLRDTAGICKTVAPLHGSAGMASVSSARESTLNCGRRSRRSPVSRTAARPGSPIWRSAASSTSDRHQGPRARGAPAGRGGRALHPVGRGAGLAPRR